jgi:hypothetical protein
MFRTAIRGSRRGFFCVYRRGFATATPNVSRYLARSTKYGALLGLGMASVYFGAPIQNDAAVNESMDTVHVDSAIDPFPITLRKSEFLSRNYELLGAGVRSVTFVGFNVYGIGLYIADSDISKARGILLAYPELDLHLKDPEKSVEVIHDLLLNGVKLVARINPVRNTDFNHLKDGLVKSILAHPRSKENREAIDLGVQQLRSIFLQRKGSVPKNHILYLEIEDGGKLLVTYENTKNGKILKMGEVTEPLISNVLFLLYLSGKKPLSESLRTNCVSKLTAL